MFVKNRVHTISNCVTARDDMTREFVCVAKLTFISLAGMLKSRHRDPLCGTKQSASPIF